MQGRIRLVLIYGSVREGRFCDQVVNWAREQIGQRSELKLSLVDPALMFRQPGESPDAGASRHQALQQLLHAEASLIVTPEYNNGYPAALKQFVDEVRPPGMRARWPARGGAAAPGAGGPARHGGAQCGEFQQRLGAVRR